MSKVDSIAKNRDMVRKMAQAGCRQVFLGLESGDENILMSFKKSITTTVSQEAVALLKNEGISVYGGFILGAIDETEASAKKTIKFSRSLKLDSVRFRMLTPYPDTRLYEEVRDRITDHDMDHYDTVNNVFALNNMTKERIEELLISANTDFWHHPRIIWRTIRSIIGDSILGRAVRAVYEAAKP
jgi:radical SAM superfamily enzyme YgiQ (UPF0313 family)